MNRLIAPIAHRNGTGETDLFEAFADAREHIRQGLEKLRLACPNQRDYYTHPISGAWSSAKDQHADRVQRLTSVVDELNALSLAVLDGQPETGGE